ncbi:MAG: right-handed parallel beta-helix repeat-containing protein [Anaerolineae bacterium]
MYIRRSLAVLALGLGLTLLLLLALNSPPQKTHAWPMPTPGSTRPPGPAFVKVGGTGDWCLQDDPCGSIQYALEQCEPGNGDTIYVAGGTYTGTGGAVITVTKSVTLYGGWDGTTTTPVVRDPDAYPTTLDGQGARRVVYITGPATVTLEGLTVANGETISTTATGWDGPGLYARDAALTLRHTKFYSNVVDVYDYDAADSYAYGGGACVEGGTLQVYTSTFWANSARARRSSEGGGMAISGTLIATVTGSLFQDNRAWDGSGLYFLGESGDHAPLILSDSIFVDNHGGYAGALMAINAQAQIEGNLFRTNRASNDYGAVSVFYSDLSLTGNVITGNQCGRTSGLHLYHVSPFTVTNNIIAGNETFYTWRIYPAVEVRYGSGRFLHNTVARNESFYGVEVADGAAVALTNTIVASHTVGITVTAGSTATLYHTLFYANSSGDTGGPGTIVNSSPITGQDPRLTADYHLGCGSPAIDAGVDAGVTTDIDGDARPHDGGYDVGADEFYGWCTYLPLVWKSD